MIHYSSHTNYWILSFFLFFNHIVEKHHPPSVINDPCNGECLLNMGRSIYEDNLNQCGKIPGFASPVMHMLMCQRLLSDLDTTKYIRMFDANPEKAKAEHRGMCQRLLLRVRTVTKRHVRSSMFVPPFNLALHVRYLSVLHLGLKYNFRLCLRLIW